MPQLARPGATLRYELWGESGPWATLVNGHTRPLNDFRMLGRHLQEQGFRILALDNRGAGETVVDTAFTLADMVDDVVALWDEVGAATTCLLGVSMGGFIAQQLALQHPRRVERLALVSTAASQAWISKDDTPWSTEVEAVLAKLTPYFTDAFRERNPMLVRSMAKQIAKNVEGGDFSGRAAQQKEAARGFDLRPRLSQLRCPTLIVHGAEDRVIPVEAARELARLVPTSRLEILAAAGHLLLAEKPRELYELVSAAFRGETSS
jgi:3-oxoadipate enol-lactonase